MKLLSRVTLATTLLATSLVGTAATSTASEIEPQVTCNYVTRNADGVNLHRDRDRSSPIRVNAPVHTGFVAVSCTDTTGGNYGSCGGGNRWKVVSYAGETGWVAARCLTRV